MAHNSVLLSPFWESVDERWIGGTLLVLSAMMLCSQAIAIARYRSRRMYLVSIMFTMLAAVLVAPLADSHSPRELQRWIMMPQTLTTLATLQILWIGITVFLSVKESVKAEAAECSHRIWDRIVHWCQLLFIRFVMALPAPVFLLFLVWIEQNLLMESNDVRPQIVGLRVGAIICGLLTLWVLLLVFWFKRHQLIGLHLLIGCFLLMTSVLIPCLTQKMNWQATWISTDPWGMTPIAGMFILLILAGIFVPKNII